MSVFKIFATINIELKNINELSLISNRLSLDVEKSIFFSFIQPKENETPLVLQKRKVKEPEYGKNDVI